jgi:ATP-dependent RNA helicase DeaD
VTNKRVSDFKQKVVEVLNAEGLDFFANIVSQIAEEQNVGAEEVAAALAMMAQEVKPLQIAGEDPRPAPAAASFDSRDSRPRPGSFGERDERKPRSSERSNERGDKPSFESRGERPRREERPARSAPPTGDMVRYRIDVGRDHGVQVKDIVGAIANEAGIESRFIGRIALYDESSTVELPAGMPGEASNALKRTRVRGVPINLRPDEGRQDGGASPERKFDGERSFKKKSFDR